MRYKWNTGSLTWLVHRVTGIVLTVYLIVHICVLSSLRDQEAYERIMEVMKNPLVKVAELILFAVLLKHAFAGLRITLLEIGVSTKIQRQLTYAGVLIVVALWTVGAYCLLREAF